MGPGTAEHPSYLDALAASGVEVCAPVSPAMAEILSEDALLFVAMITRFARDRRAELLDRRVARQTEIDAGALPDFLPETREIRLADWTIAAVPADLQDRRVEITGPVDRKMVINALNAGTKTYMADFEDSHSPAWEGTVHGQINLRDAIRRTISFAAPGGKEYRLNDSPAVLIVRPRGWHLVEKHMRVDGQPVPAGLFDFGLYFFHNAKELLRRGSGPYFYLPKLESHLEARLWNDVFVRAQEELGIPHGAIKATVLIETITAAFEMHEILYELRDHSAGLNCGRWDYIFSCIKKFRNHPDRVYPDRAQVTMTSHFMHAYSLLAIQTCHRRGAHAIGGMAAQIPIKHDPAANEAALEKVRADKAREAADGHDGTWVAHPGLVSVAMAEFDKHMPGPNQIDKTLSGLLIDREDLLRMPDGAITESGLRTNISVGVQYMAAWLGGNGCVPLYNLMEDAATAEISRSQCWQWVHSERGVLDDGRNITIELFRDVMREEMEKIKEAAGAEAYARGHYELAARLFDETITRPQLDEFLTLIAYDHLE